MATVEYLSKDIKALTGIRGVAALVVVIHHVFIWSGLPVLVRGQWAVDLFFALSGFVISLSYLGKSHINWRRFFAARIGRIYPLYIITSMLSAGALYWQSLRHERIQSLFTTINIVRQVTLTMAMPLIGGGRIWNDPSWSISVEWWTYILLFGTLVWVQRRSSPWLTAVAVTGLLMALATYLTFNFLDSAPVRGWSAFGRATFGFAGGWAACRLWREKSFTLPPFITDLLALTMIATVVLYGLNERDAWWLLPLYPVFILGLTRRGSRTVYLLSAPPLVFLGDISYSVYLIHPLVLLIIQFSLHRLQLDKYAIALMGLTLVATIACSFLSYNYLEKPLGIRLRRALEK